MPRKIMHNPNVATTSRNNPCLVAQFQVAVPTIYRRLVPSEKASSARPALSARRYDARLVFHENLLGKIDVRYDAKDFTRDHQRRNASNHLVIGFADYYEWQFFPHAV
jgi:hypothetical protein